jgi:hypothetical protein
MIQGNKATPARPDADCASKPVHKARSLTIQPVFSRSCHSTSLLIFHSLVSSHARLAQALQYGRVLTILISFAFVAPKARASKMLNLVNYRLKVTLFVLSLRFALSIRLVYLPYLIRILFIVV